VRAKVGRTAVAANAMGTTPAFLGIRGFRLASGRFLDDTDQREARRVAVLGARIADTLFPDGGAVGREVRLRGVPFEVIGTLAAKGAALGGGDEDTVIVMPMTTALRRVFNRPWLSAVFVSAADPASMDRTGVAVGRLVRVRHRPARDGRDDFEVQNTARLLTLQRQTLDLLGWLTAGLAVLTLAGGGSSVLAVMWLSVSDRTGEIGLRRAVGATDTAIVGQFLAEATALAVAGWLAGLAAAGVAIAAAANATRWSIGLPADALALSAAMVAIAALVPGAVAAIRAARIAPVEALRKA
jgi:putative ABC transport system permease protein